MLKLHSLKPYHKSKKRRKVVGRGFGSGHGTFSGRGAKGQKARSGASIPIGFEGGRMPLHRQIPKKRGFRSRNIKPIAVNLSDLSRKFKSGETINPKMLLNKGLIKSADLPVKIVGHGEATSGLIFEKLMISKTAEEKISKAGGKINK